MFLQHYFVQRQPLQEGHDGSSSDTDSSEPECIRLVPDEDSQLSVTPDKVGLIKDVFPNLNSDEAILLLNLLHGNVHKVISVCLKGLNTSTIIRVFKSARMLTRIKKVFVNPDSILRDALCLYKSSSFNIAKPIEVEIIGSEAVDLGGPRRQFFNTVLEGLARNEHLRLFDGDMDNGWLLPAVNHDAIICGHFKMLGRIIIHSLLLDGPGFPFFPPPIYYYLVHGTIDSAMPYLDIRFLPARQKAIVDQVR